MRRTLLAQMQPKAVSDEGDQLFTRIRETLTQREKGALEGLCERQAQTVFENEPDHAECRTTQRERISRPGRLFADREEGNERVDLVGESGHDTIWGGRAGVIR